MKQTLHKALSILIMAIMVLNMVQTPVFAKGAESDLHEHNKDCGYVEDGDCNFDFVSEEKTASSNSSAANERGMADEGGTADGNEPVTDEKPDSSVETTPEPEIEESRKNGIPITQEPSGKSSNTEVKNSTELNAALADTSVTAIDVTATFGISQAFNTSKTITIKNGFTFIVATGNISANIVVDSGAKLKLNGVASRLKVDGTLVNNGTVEKTGLMLSHIAADFTNTGTITVTQGILVYDYGKLTNSGTVPALGSSFKCNINANIANKPSIGYEPSTITAGDTIKLVPTGLIAGVNLEEVLSIKWYRNTNTIIDSANNKAEYTTTSVDAGSSLKVKFFSWTTGYVALSSSGSHGVPDIINNISVKKATLDTVYLGGTKGKDSNSGATAELPFASLPAALENLNANGTVILVGTAKLLKNDGGYATESNMAINSNITIKSQSGTHSLNTNSRKIDNSLTVAAGASLILDHVTFTPSPDPIKFVGKGSSNLKLIGNCGSVAGISSFSVVTMDAATLLSANSNSLTPFINTTTFNFNNESVINGTFYTHDFISSGTSGKLVFDGYSINSITNTICIENPIDIEINSISEDKLATAPKTFLYSDTAMAGDIVKNFNITNSSELGDYLAYLQEGNKRVNISFQYAPADYSKVNEAIAKIPSDLSNYTADSVKVLNDAKDAVVRDKNITDQAVVDGYATAIENAIKALKYKGADYTKVDAAIAKIPSDLSCYTADSVKVLKDAKDAVVRGKNITEQAVVDGYATAIEDAIKVLKYNEAAHTWNSGTVTTPPTHTEDGVKTFTCTVCSQTKTEAIAATGHTWSTEWSKDAVNHWHKCTTDDTIKDKAAHTFGDWIIDKAATETETGSKHRDCSVCEYSETVTIPVNPHTHKPSSEWSKDVNTHWHNCTANDGERMNEAAHTWNGGAVTTPPTHTQDGVKTYTCSVCSQTKTEAIPKLPSNSALVDNSTGTKVEYEDGSTFDASIVLSVTSKPQAEMDKFNNAVDKAAPGLVLGGLYDVELLKDGVAIQPDGKVKVSIPLTDKMKSMTNLQVVYIDDNGNITIIPSEIIDGKLVFVTDHFSYYGVIGKVKASDPGNNNGGENNNSNNGNTNSPQTGDSSPVLLFVLMMLASGIALVILTQKRKIFKRCKK